MSTRNSAFQPFPEVWEDLVSDFLETACLLTSDQRDFLLQRLVQIEFTAEAIEIHPGFSIEDKIEVICENRDVREIWIYLPSAKSVKTFSFPKD